MRIDIRPSDNKDKNNKRAEFCNRWYKKFGEPRPHTLPADKFMERLKEMRDFE